MRLISCYVAGFGKLVGRSFDFRADLTVLKEDNGWGKTTLADFLKCMLYGMDNGRGKSVGANERMKYEPWHGNVFGGSLVFSYREKQYRIERSFGKTAASDAVRVYDENNMQTYEFGDKAERLGDILFGVDRESYQRSVYIPQGAVQTGGLPDDMKNRLLSLLGNGGADDNGAERAMERLDVAERSLRAKRRPAKGKLDEIDERLDSLARERAACEEYGTLFTKTEEERRQVTSELHACGERLKGLDASLEQISRQNELASKQELYAELQSQKNALQVELSKMQLFFGEIDPGTVNLQGVQTAITEFYTLKKELSDLEERLYKAESQSRELATTSARVSQLEQTLSACKQGWAQENERQSRKSEKRHGRERKKSKFFGLFLFFALAAVIGGGILSSTDFAVLGYLLLGVGALILAVSFFNALPAKRSRDNGDDVELTSMIEYQQAEGELAGLRKRLESFPADLETSRATLSAAHEEKKTRADGLEKAIVRFLQNFRFEEIYDYRVSLATLRDNAETKIRLTQEMARCEEKLRALTSENADVLGARERLQEADSERFKEARKAEERKRDELLSIRARLSAQAEEYEKKSKTEDLDAETSRLTEEKTRLEKKLYAVREAKKFLLRAKENMATRYLDPVGKSCEKYLLSLGADSEIIRFAADGAAFFEENGTLRETEYYSAGWKELIGFCTRLSLAEAVFVKEPPTLILDDPFANLDDKKTEKAKKLLKELSGRYQILYFTCKKERAF